MSGDADGVGHHLRREALEALRRRHRARLLRVPVLAHEVLVRVRQHLRHGPEDHGRKPEREDGGAGGGRRRAQAPPAPRAEELEEKVQARAGARVEKRLRVAGGGDQQDRSDHDRGAARSGLARDAPDAEEKQRNRCRRRHRRHAQVEDHPVRERPGEAAEERRPRAAAEVPQEEKRGQERDQEPQRHVEGPRLRQRQQHPEERAGMQDGGLRDAERAARPPGRAGSRAAAGPRRTPRAPRRATGSAGTRRRKAAACGRRRRKAPAASTRRDGRCRGCRRARRPRP